MTRLLAAVTVTVAAACVLPLPAAAACHRIYTTHGTERYVLVCEDAKTSDAAVAEATIVVSNCKGGVCSEVSKTETKKVGVQKASTPETRDGTIGPFPGVCVLLRCTPQYVPTKGIHHERDAGETIGVVLLFGVPLELRSPVGYCVSTVSECTQDPGSTSIGGIVRADGP